MRSLRSLTASVVLLASLATVVSADTVVDPSGTWRWEYEMQGQTIQDAMRLNLKEGKVAGTFHGQDRIAQVEDATFSDRRLTAAVKLDFNGTSVRLVFSGKINGDEIDGTVNADFQGEAREYPWKPTRSVKLEDVVGNWDLEIKAAGYTFEPKLEISKNNHQFEMVYTSNEGIKLEAEGLQVDDQNNLKFTVRSTYDGLPMKVDYQGRPFGDKISGKIFYDVGGNSGEAPYTGTRKLSGK